MALDEAAAMVRRAESYEQTRSLVQAALRTKYEPKPRPADYFGGPYIRDFYGDRVIFEWEGKTWQVEYTIARAETTSVTLGDAVEVEIAYLPIGTKTVESEVELNTDFLPLSEAKALRQDGTATIKLIAPGWGSSGYYSQEMLERDGPKVFKKGLKQYWNHPTKSEEAERPERDLRDLAAELVSDARWESRGAAGPGLYAETKVFGPYRESVQELAPHIGVSIRAMGKGKPGEAEGRKGTIVESINVAKSADYVTAPGAGGQVLSLFESARERTTTEESTMSEAELQEARTRAEAAEARVKELEEAQRKQAEDLARFREAQLISEARGLATEGLSKANLPEIAKARVIDGLVTGKALAESVKDGALDKEAFARAVVEAARKEAEYVTSISGNTGAVTGMGGGATGLSEADAAKKLEAGFTALGLSEAAVKFAVAGRNN